MQIVNRHAIWALIPFFFFTSTALGEEVRIEKGKVDIAIASAGQGQALKANVHVSFQLRNMSKQANDARRVFPVTAPLRWKYSTPDKSRCRVSVNGKMVEAKTEMLPTTESRLQQFPSKEQRAAWNQRIEQWIAKDAQLQQLIAQYRQPTKSRPEVGKVTEEFKKRVKRYLVHKELEHEAFYVASNDSYFGHLVKLMPEIDPSLRIDGAYQRWKYLSILDEYRSEIYRPYEAEWRKKADDWLASKPGLAELLPKLRKVWSDLRAAQKLLNGPIFKHLHDASLVSIEIANRHRLNVSRQVKQFLEHGRSLPSASLVRELFPDIREQFDVEEAKITTRLAKWGFSESALSPFTGRPMHIRDYRLDFGNLWRDQTVLAELGRPARPSDPSQRIQTLSFLPTLVSFDAPLQAGETATVTLEYTADISSLANPYNSAIRFGGPSELATIFPSPDNVAVTVTCPSDIQPIIGPAPHNIAVKGEPRQFDVRLAKDTPMLRLVPVAIGKDKHSWSSRFSNDSRVEGDLRTLIDKVKNPTVRPMLMSALYSILLKSQKRWEAHQLTLQIADEHPDFAPILTVLQTGSYGAKEARQMHEWVAAKAKSPQFLSEVDLKRFDASSSSSVLTPNALTELARRVKQLDNADLNLQEQMGRRFVLCQAGIEADDNLAKLLELAKANPKSAIESLRLIQFMTIDKSAALPYVLSQIDLKLREKARAGKVKATDFLWARQNEAYYALCTFQSPKAAPGLIQFILKTNDSLLVQGATKALSHMALKDRFNALASIADHVAASSESAYIQYLDLILRSDPSRKRALPLLESLRKKYPRLAPRVMRALGRAKHQMQLPEALEVYDKTPDVKGKLQAAINVLGDLATSQDVATMEYRKGLPRWMNESLVSIIRSQGGNKSHFPFVEAYYKEHVRGKKAHNHLTCVAAFEQIGDPRAIPYLQEIFKTTERKRDAATAIGSLKLNRSLKRRQTENPLDRALRTARNSNEPMTVREAAWNVLLADPDAAFQRAMNGSSVSTRSTLSAVDRDGLAFITRFGDTAARQLLKESEGCSLEKRYRIAELLGMLPKSRAIIEASAKDESIDADRRRTAHLALKAHD